MARRTASSSKSTVSAGEAGTRWRRWRPFAGCATRRWRPPGGRSSTRGRVTRTSRARNSSSSAGGRVEAACIMRRLTERRRWWLLFILAAGCRSADPDRDPERTIPVSVQVRASPKRSEAPLNAEFLAGELAAAFRAGSIFSEVRSDDGSRPGFSPLPADYLCEVEVRGATLRPDHSETTERAILSTVAWFFTVFPAWWIADRLYPASDVEVRATFLPAGEGNSGKAVPVLSENLPLNNLELDLRRRGNAWQHLLSLLLPPFWMEDAAVAERGLREEAVRVARVSLPEG